jgi:hypothetical protein
MVLKRKVIAPVGQSKPSHPACSQSLYSINKRRRKVKLERKQVISGICLEGNKLSIDTLQQLQFISGDKKIIQITHNLFLLNPSNF